MSQKEGRNLEKTHSLYGLRIALLIDFDNVILGVDDPPGFDVELVVNALRSRGSVVLGRAYGDWYRHHRHRRKLMEQGIELVETPVFGPLIKNSADIRIVLDGFEIAMQQSHIDTFCLVSGDSDFLPLIKKLQYLGKQVIVIAGTKFTSELVRRNCNEYVSYENLLAESVGADEDATTLDGALHLLQRTIVNLHELGMEVRSSTVKQMMVQLNPVFSERNFGFSQFKQFLDKAVKAGLITLGGRDPSSGEYMVFLTDDDINGDAVQSTPASNGTAARPSRRRSSRTRKTKAEAAPETTEETPGETMSATVEALSTPEDEIEESRPEDSLLSGEGERGTLRRGRLRFSGRTWKSGATRSAEPTTTENGDAPAQEQPEETSDEATPPVSEETAEEVTPEETPDEAKTSDETQTEPETEVKEEKPARKRTSRGGRKRKTEAAADAKETADADTTTDEAKPADGEAKPSEGETQADEETAEKKPAAKRTRTRRTTRKKAADAESSETPATEDTSGQTEASGKAKTSDEAATSDSAEGEGEEKPKRKTTRRRRTTRKKAEETSEE